MLLNLIRSQTDPRWVIIYFLLTLPAILLALTCHEVAHGWVSYKLGDPTAYNMGRLTLNPIKHLDPIGTLAMLLVGVGWAKPVPVNSRYYKKPKFGMALTALAGPVTNLLLGFIGVILYFVSILIVGSIAIDPMLADIIVTFFEYFAMLNVSLAVFNLIPVPPFDGSRIAFVFLPTKWYFQIMRYERVIMLVMLVLLATGALSGGISLVTNTLLNGMVSLVATVIGWFI